MASQTKQGIAGQRPAAAPSGETLSRQPMQSTETTGKNPPKPTLDAITFRMWAISEAWSGAYLMEPHAALTQLGDTPTSGLGGNMLRMYLRGEIDPSVIQEVAKEIESSKQFDTLSDMVSGHLRIKANTTFKALPSDEQIIAESRAFLKSLKQTRGIAFREDLNAIIGGVTGIDVVGPVANATRTSVGDSSSLSAEITVEVADEYDFKNTRTGDYERFRRRLYDLILRQEYSRFLLEYHRELYLLGSLGPQGAFASFMYAIERAGYTPGTLKWSAKMRMKLKVAYP